MCVRKLCFCLLLINSKLIFFPSPKKSRFPKRHSSLFIYTILTAALALALCVYPKHNKINFSLKLSIIKIYIESCQISLARSRVRAHSFVL